MRTCLVSINCVIFFRLYRIEKDISVRNVGMLVQKLILFHNFYYRILQKSWLS